MSYTHTSMAIINSKDWSIFVHIQNCSMLHKVSKHNLPLNALWQFWLSFRWEQICLSLSPWQIATLSNWTLRTKANFYCSHNFKQPGEWFPILLLLEISVCHVQQSAMSLLWLTLNKTFARTFIGQMCKTRSLQIVHMSIGSGLTEILNCIWDNIFCCEEASKHLCVFLFYFLTREP
jgi:hypothetical protein